MQLPIGVLQQQGGGVVYDPGMMTYGGAGHYLDSTVAQSGNLQTAVARFKVSAFTGGGQTRIFTSSSSGQGNAIFLAVQSSDHADVDKRSKVWLISQNSGSTIVCSIISNATVADGAEHTIFAAFDGDNGTAQLYVDGVDSDNTGWASRVLTTGTLGLTAPKFAVGANVTGAERITGEIGYVGFDDSYLTNPTDFYHPTNGLQEIDESGWTEWGSQPLFWNQYGTMNDNKGSAGNMTANGTITGPD